MDIRAAHGHSQGCRSPPGCLDIEKPEVEVFALTLNIPNLLLHQETGSRAWDSSAIGPCTQTPDPNASAIQPPPAPAPLTLTLTLCEHQHH